MNDSKETTSSRYNRADAHMHSQRLWRHAQESTGSNQTEFQHWRKGHKVPFLTKKLFTIELMPSVKRKSSFSSGVLLVMSTKWRLHGHDHEQWANRSRNGHCVFFWGGWYWWCLSYWLCLFVFLIFCFALLLRTWEELRESKDYDQNTVYGRNFKEK